MANLFGRGKKVLYEELYVGGYHADTISVCLSSLLHLPLFHLGGILAAGGMNSLISLRALHAAVS